MIAIRVPHTWTKAGLLVGAALLAMPALAQDRALGLIVQNNINAQLVDPNPVYDGVPIEGSNGMKADTAITRYRTGRVMPLQTVLGTSVIGGAGGAGGGGAAGSAPPPSAGPR